MEGIGNRISIVAEGSWKAPAAMMPAWNSNRLVFIFLRF
jgi:hypothetical protein